MTTHLSDDESMIPRRVLLVTHRFLPRYVAGTEVYTASLAQGLAARGHSVRVFTGDPSTRRPYSYDWGGIPVTAVPWGLCGRGGPVTTFLASFLNPSVERHFVRLCAEFDPNVVHVQHLMGLSLRLMALARRQGARVVVTLHDFWFACSNTWLYRWDHVQCPGPGWGYHCAGCALHRLNLSPRPLVMAMAAPLFMARTLCVRAAQRHVDNFIAPSRISAKIFLEHGGHPERVSLLPHAIHTARLPVPVSANPASRPIRFVFLGSLIPPKGLHVALAAFNELNDRRTELYVYGDLGTHPAYARELQKLAHRPGVKFKGAVPREAARSVIAEADLLLLPALWYESYSIVVDEAFSLGVPVLVSDHSAPAERVIPGVNGLAAPPGDVLAWKRQMQRFVDDPELRNRLRHGIRPPPSLEPHVLAIEAVYAQR